MKKGFHWLSALAVLGLLATSGTAAAKTALEIELEGAIGVATAEYVVNGINKANDDGADLIILRTDTPGGLDAAMRDIIQAILNSDVPVVTYVSPSGARADSAGTYILLASHVAAMAPTTHLGAATPVAIGGDDVSPPPEPDAVDDEEEAENGDTSESDESDNEPSTAMGRKVLNDAVAYIRGLAESQGRNADWAEKAVRDAATLTAEEALAENVIDVIAEDTDALLEQIDGMEVTLDNEPYTLATADINVRTFEKTWRNRFLETIASPEIILILFSIGLYGLMLEGYNPGAIYPGVAGAICLLLALYAVQILPVNYAGMALMIVGVVLIVAETLVPSFGVLGFGGIIAFAFGAILTFDSGVPGFGISKAFVVSFTVVTGGLMFLMATYLVKQRRRQAVSGVESIIGATGTAMDSFAGEGMVWLDGESWAANSSTPIEKDQEVRVRAIDGLTLLVDPVEKP